MTTTKNKLTHLKYVACLLGILGFLMSGFHTELRAAGMDIKEEKPALHSNVVQDLTVTGTITGAEDGVPVPGANVIIKGTTSGTTTDFDGNYSITVPSSEAVLVFSYIGFKIQEIGVAGKTNIDVSMEPDIAALDEVVVVGFGTQKKATLTGSVTQVSGDEVFAGKGTSSATQALQGEVAGLVVTRNAARPGNEELDIQIRGDISVNNIDPLILVDGLEIPLSQLSSINANDIETYSVLKDASAAIYGTKAAGGVILITTKKGKVGAPVVNYKGETQMNFAGDMPIADIKEWARFWLLADDNDTFEYTDVDGNVIQATGTYRFPGSGREFYESILDNTLPLAPDTYFFNNRDHRLADANQFEAVYGTTFSQRHDLSVSGGAENVTYRSSIGYANERSPISVVYDGQKRYNFRTNLTYQISDMIKTDLNISYDDRLIDVPTIGVGEGIQDFYIFPLFNPQGQYYDIFGANNILAKLDEGGRTKDNIKVFRLGGKIDLDLNRYAKGLSLSYFGNYSTTHGIKTQRATSYQLFDWEGNVSFNPVSLANSGVQFFETNVDFQNHVIKANYNRTFGKHNFGLLAGITSETEQTVRTYTARTNLISDDLDDINTGDVTTQVTGGSHTDNNGSRFNSGRFAVGLVSYIGQINYNYDDTYLLEALGRRDGSSRLDPDFRWQNFFGASGGMVFSEMGFIENLNTFDFLKLRASYGETGSVTGIGPYDYISNINTGSFAFGSPASLVNTANIAGLTISDRTWERVTTTNFAIDFTILDSRLSSTVEYYVRKNNDMLIPITYPQVLGTGAPRTNSGDFETKGWEASLSWRDKIGDFQYNFGLSAWDSQSEVTRFEGADAIQVGVNSGGNVIEGKPLNAIYGYRTDGYLQNEAEIVAYYNQFAFVDPSDQSVSKPGSKIPAFLNPDQRLIPGSVRRVDANGDGNITEDDLVYLGDANPHYSFGINLGLKYKGFDFTAFFQGVGQQNIVREGALAYPFRYWFRNQNPVFLDNSWTPDNPNAQYPVVSYSQGDRNRWNYGETNDINIIQAAYMRAKVLSLGYSLPRSVLDNLGLDRLRLSLTGNDLFVITNVNDGLDPEKGAEANQGDSVPYTSSLILGLEVTF